MKKFGRLPRKFNPKILHMNTVRAMRLTAPIPPPESINMIAPIVALATKLQMFLNNVLGCCTCAAIYHARQVFSALANPPMEEDTDAMVEIVYEKACGYVPGKASTDRGGIEQDVLAYWQNTGVPVAGGVDKLLMFVEEDPKNIAGVKWGLNDCGVVYIGFQLPQSFLDAVESGNVPDVWDVVPGDTLTDEGHCVILIPEYDGSGVSLISWGQIYKMTWAFFGMAVDECYPLVDRDWITAKGTTPGGVQLALLENEVQALKEA